MREEMSTNLKDATTAVWMVASSVDRRAVYSAASTAASKAAWSVGCLATMEREMR